MAKCSKKACSRETFDDKNQCTQCRANAVQASARQRAKKRITTDVNAAPPPVLAPLPSNRKRALLPSAPNLAGISAPSAAQGEQTDSPAPKKAKISLPSYYVNRSAMINALHLEVLRAKRTSTPAEFSGFYIIPEDSREKDKDHIHSVNHNILAATQIRFTVDENDTKRASGLATTFYCSQDARRKQKARKTEDAEKQRDTLGMDRFPCESRLHISITHRPASGVQEIAVRFRHEVQHVAYQCIQ